MAILLPVLITLFANLLITCVSIDRSNLTMLYLLGVAFISTHYSRGAAIISSFVSVAFLSSFFIIDFLEFTVSDLEYVLTLVMMLVVSLLINHLSQSLKQEVRQKEEANMLIEIERARSALLGSVSHDLKTPLTTILGASSNLLNYGHNQNQIFVLEAASSIYKESERLNRLVNNLLSISKAESGALLLSLEWNSLEEVVGNVLPHFENQLIDKKLIIDLSETLPLIKVDAVLIDQLISNLLDNAIKYGDKNGLIRISAKVVDGEIVIEIFNSGDSLSDKDLPLIFEKFYRLNNSDTIAGSGLGLTIVKAIVKLHNGSIEASNQTDSQNGLSGICFTIRLPISEQAPQVKEDNFGNE